MQMTASEAAANAMEQTAEQLQEILKDLEKEAETVLASFEENRSGLGCHADSISSLLEALQPAVQQAGSQCKGLSLKMKRAAALRRKLLTNNPYAGKNHAETKTGTGRGANASDYLTDRTIFELETLESDLELTDGDPDTLQLGGSYQSVRQQTAGKPYQAHHIPAQSMMAADSNELPTIAITDEDHRGTSTYGGKMGSKYHTTLPIREQPVKHKETLLGLLQKGLLAEVIRAEILELRRDYGHKYDGGIRQYIAAMIAYLNKNGVPKTKG